MFLSEIHQWFKGHFLNKLRVSFKDQIMVWIHPIAHDINKMSIERL